MSTPFPDSERERLQTQYAEIATLAGGLAHEIRNPLSTIQMNLELLGEDLEESSDPKLQRSLRKLERIRQECKHLEEILSAFLDFARAGQLDLELLDLAELVNEFVDFYRPQASEHGVELSPHLATNLPLVQVDRALMKQVLMNLALNAQQAMPNGGEISLQAYTQGDSVHLEIIDTGTGMTPQAQESMFQVFFSTKPGGSGLGLPTVRKIIEAHDGSISCESELGRGTRFTIILPAQVPLH
ncbi:MAG: ATP-binding protein [Planctomycetaceae bacterium]